MGFSFPMMWDACGILKKVKTFRYRIRLCKCGINVGFSKNDFLFLLFGTEFVICQSAICLRWLWGGGFQANGATVSSFFLQICNPK